MAIIGQAQFDLFPQDLRFDPDYYIGEGAKDREGFKKTGKPFDHWFARIIHPGEFTRTYEAAGHLFLRAQNVRPGQIKVESPVFVSDAIYNALPEAVAQEDDLLLVRTGANLADAARVPKAHSGALVSSHTLRLVPKPRTPIFALSAFFASDIGRRVLLSLKTGGTHGQLNGFSLRTLYLPDLSHIEDKCRKLFSEIDRLDSISVEQYPKAEAELLERIGWKELGEKPCELYYTEDFKTLTERERIDAEHYQPKYDRLAKRLEKFGAIPLEELLAMPPGKGTQPDEYVEEGEVIVVKSKNVFGRGIELASCERTSLRAWADEFARLKENDVVINSTGRGTLGRAGVIHCNGQKIVASVDLLILRAKPELVDPDYLSLFLNSSVGIAQSEQYQTGSSGQLHLYPAHIQQFLIYVPKNSNGRVDLGWQRKLADKVRIAARAKVEARAKLEEAKRLVESSIAGDGRKAKV
ncbi:MAG: hypothetical protein Q8R91_05255 [Candidatus Omnitrophota bacterium]|nr:hypothetical protein [Candidatus Omnitrophota bacterium]